MTTLTQASQQWASRPSEERFTSLPAMLDVMRSNRERSVSKVLPNRRLRAEPVGDDHRGLVVTGPNGGAVVPTHWAFGQLAQLAQAPAGYLRTLPSEMAADCINYGLHCSRDVQEVGVYLTAGEDGEPKTMRAATGPNYGRVYNADIVKSLVKRFGDGVTGDWRVPGEFGRAVEVSKANTTLYASDRDMFVFLADEVNRLEIKDRRDGKGGSLARGFFVWNSEVGSATLGIAMFLFDYVCQNRIVWGAQDVQRVTVRHTSGAPDRWIEDVKPMIRAMANSAAGPTEARIAAAQAQKIDKVGDFLAKRFTKAQATAIQNVAMIEEQRPIETAWDAVAAVTAYAKGIEHQSERVLIEREAGKILDLVAV